MAGDFQNGLAYVETTKEIGYINHGGDFVWKSPYVDTGMALIS